ncbi:MAG TPA: hypothetical protein VGL97_17725 [Bryobacteraceae bacterium]|jgi:hypothetical protein
MEPFEREIALAAINVGRDDNWPRLLSTVALQTNKTPDEIRAVLDRLHDNLILKRCTTNARNVDVDPVYRGATQIWYEKGELWD